MEGALCFVGGMESEIEVRWKLNERGRRESPRGREKEKGGLLGWKACSPMRGKEKERRWE